MVIYLFRDEANSEHFAFTIDATGANIPPITPLTERIFLEAIDTLKFVEPWDIGDFRGVLDHLKIFREMERLAPVAAPGFTVSCMTLGYAARLTRRRTRLFSNASLFLPHQTTILDREGMELTNVAEAAKARGAAVARDHGAGISEGGTPWRRNDVTDEGLRTVFELPFEDSNENRGNLH
jgi:hypothetical protein